MCDYLEYTYCWFGKIKNTNLILSCPFYCGFMKCRHNYSSAWCFIVIKCVILKIILVSLLAETVTWKRETVFMKDVLELPVGH